MSLLTAYRASLKPLEVEEPIDVYVHRPLGFLVASASFHTPVSPNAITVLSIIAGVAAGIALISSFRFHMQVGGLLIFLSAVLDCADGQLARMRKTSSVFGRMLDGMADLITTSFIAPATLIVLWRMYHSPLWLSVTVVVIGVITIITSSFHTTSYDHYKNVWVRLTSDSYEEGEDYESALARWKSSASSLTWWKRITFRVYLFYVKSQRDYALSFDPHTNPSLNSYPPYQPDRAAIYRRHAARPMALFRGFFGFGSLIFGLALFNALGRPDVYLALRLLLLNSIFFFYLRPMQRKASQAAFNEMGLPQASTT